MNPVDVIRQKRDGEALPPADLQAFLRGYTDGSVPEYQMSALAMAVYFRGLSEAELDAWTRAMLHSGDVLDLSDIPGGKVDKHSTGGVGDKISIPLAPLVAACGVKVPMLSGRGLGHTGGTLDKLESIPGFRVQLSGDEFRRLVSTVGVALGGQTERIVPADRKLYALRDVTATVESIPLIASSILSKKLAEGIDALVLDVKFGSGAFMREKARARELAQTMVRIGKGFGKAVVALLTDMNQPLGAMVGNALEIIESIQVLKGEGPDDVRDLTLALGAEMLVLGGAAATHEDARARLVAAIDDGSALRKLEEIVQAQGGDPRALTDHARLPRARHRVNVLAPRAGYVGSIRADEVGRAAMLLGAGRQKVDDVINPAVGIELRCRLGDRLDAGQPMAVLHTDSLGLVEPARQRLLAAYTFTDEPSAPGPLVAERIA